MTSSAHEAQDLVPGQRLLDRYSIIDRVASGGMATIYRANDDRLDRIVCVKLLRTVLTGSGSTNGGAVYQATYDHFLKEALALSKLQHPNTLKIFDFGFMEPNRPFQISEYLDGGNLEGHVRHRGAIAHNEIVSILERMTGAVAEAHEHKIIHRDIKPSNILFARVGESLLPKLADFGIAHSDVKRAGDGEEEDDTESLSTVTLFSPRWAAPEQLCGAPEGPYTDVYALALVTAFMLTGKIPFSDNDVRATFTERVQSDEFVAERLAWLGLVGEVGQVLFSALKASPGKRLPSAPLFFDAIRGCLRGSVVSMPAVNAPAVHASPQQNAAPQTHAPRHTPPPMSAPIPPAAPSASEVRSKPEVQQQPQQLQQQPQLPPPSPFAPPPESLVMELPDAPHREPVVSASPFGSRTVRYVTVHEKLDLSFLDERGGEVRFRVSFLPTRDSLNVKGLNCFICRTGGRPTSAITATADGHADLMSTKREVLGAISWFFGTQTPTGRLFVVDGSQLVVPYPEATQAVALLPSRGRDLVVMMRR